VQGVFADELYAVAMYGSHAIGSDLDRREVKKLENFAQQIAVSCERVTKNSVQNLVERLRQQIAEQHDASSEYSFVRSAGRRKDETREIEPAHAA
jgi:hypothetical protein